MKMAGVIRLWIYLSIVCYMISINGVVESQEGSGDDGAPPDQEEEEESTTRPEIKEYPPTEISGKTYVKDVCKSDPCHNDGECQTVRYDSMPTFKCNCKNGYTGKQCDTEPDEILKARAIAHHCVHSPCANGGTCKLNTDWTKYTCHCVQGYSGKNCQTGSGGGGKINISPCNPNPCPVGEACEILPGLNVPLCTPISNSCNQNQCKNGATCAPVTGGIGYQCRCTQGFSGTFCETGGNQPTGCNPNPCQNGGRCSINTLTNVVSCTCSGSFSGPRCTSIVRPDPCQPNPCGGNGHCVEYLGAARCNCHSGWTGTNCRIRSSNLCIPNPCMPYGTCSTTGQTYSCQCNGGYTGQHCKIPPNPCRQNQCLNGGGCTPVGNSFNCVCLNGYSGQRCEIPPNPCTTNQCQNGGGCIPSGNSFICSCVNGYSGQRCEVSPNPCALNLCQNGGGCIASGNGFVCSCVNGYSGPRCGIPPNPCAMNPCKNGGICSPVGNSFTCSCVNRFSGQLCENPPNPCLVNPCLNGGGCTQSGNSFTCVCVNGFTGHLCQTLSGPCAQNKCLNNGKCVPVNALKFLCSCVNGYTGDRCQIDPKSACAVKPCLNNGVCSQSGTGLTAFTCNCVNGFIGTRCEIPPISTNPCDSKPCKNSATCQVIGKLYICYCQPGYLGIHCEVPPNKCAPNPCLNRGTCQSIGSTFKCFCTTVWQGPKCEIPVSKSGVCDPNPCRGDCLCSPSCRHARGYYCKGSTGYLGKNCTIAPPVVTCGENTITISINPAIVNEYDGGKGGFSMFMAETHSMRFASTCSATTQGGMYTFTLQLPFAKCGTNVNSGPDGKTDVSNKIWINKFLASGLADMPVPIIHFVCKYEKQYSIVASLKPSVNVAPTIVSRGAKSNPANIELCKSGSACPNKCQLPYSLTNGAFYTVGETLYLLFTTTVQGFQFTLYDLFLSCAPDVSATSATAPVVLMSGGCKPVGAGKYLELTARPFGSAICASFQVPKLTGCSQFYIHAKLQPCTSNCLAAYPQCSNRGKRSELIVIDENMKKRHKIQVYGPIYTINGKSGVVTKVMYPGKEYVNGSGTGILIIKGDPVDAEDPPSSNIPLHVALGILLLMAVIIFSVLVGHNWHYINAHCGRKF